MKRILRAGAVVVATLLASEVAALEINTPAPDFNATSTKGKIILSQILTEGPVILASYYADFTSG